MSNQAPSEPVNNVTERTLDLGAETRKAWGPKWNEPTVEYIFGSGKRERKFSRRTEDSSIYQG